MTKLCQILKADQKSREVASFSNLGDLNDDSFSETVRQSDGLDVRELSTANLAL